MRRSGFTLLEVLVATGIGVVVVGITMTAYFGAQKAQAISVGSGLLKVSAQKTLNQLYTQLHANRHVFDRNDVTETFLARLPIRPFDAAGLSPGLPSPDPFVDLRLPQARDDGSFLQQLIDGSPGPGFDAGSVGNCLLFATVEPQVALAEAAPAPVQSPTFGGDTYLLAATRLHFYFLVRRDMGVRFTPVRPGQRYVYQLMYWQSEPYLDYRDVVKWMTAIKDENPAGADAFIDEKLDALKDPTRPLHFAGALDVGGADAGLSASPGVLFDLTAVSGKRDLVRNTTARFATARFLSAVDFSMKAAFGEPMIAFNTTGAGGVQVPGLDVPAFASDSTTWPMGFEVMVAGPPELRKVLTRLSLAARPRASRNLIGQTHQQVVQIFEYGGAEATPPP